MQHLMKVKVNKKKHKYIKRYKEALWKRWKYEYLVAEKHNLKNKHKIFEINVGDAVMIKGEEKN